MVIGNPSGSRLLFFLSMLEINKNLKNPFVLVETMSVMMWLYVSPCEQAHSQNIHPHHPSLRDSTRTKEKPRKRSEPTISDDTIPFLTKNEDGDS